MTDPDQAYGAIQTSNPTNTLDTPVKKPIDKEQGLAKQNSNFEIETPCFKAPVVNIGGISMYSNLPKQPSIEKASKFSHEDIPSILPSKRQAEKLGACGLKLFAFLILYFTFSRDFSSALRSS